MSAHQTTLDYVNQILQTCSTEGGQERRYEHNQFAEQQGRVNHQWLCLQEALNSQVGFSVQCTLTTTIATTSTAANTSTTTTEYCSSGCHLSISCKACFLFTWTLPLRWRSWSSS